LLVDDLGNTAILMAVYEVYFGYPVVVFEETGYRICDACMMNIIDALKSLS